MTIRALLFDLDGTLVRTNDAHVDAWLDAIAAFGYRVGRRRIEIEIGKGGDLLVPSVLGDDVEAASGEALRGAHAERFRERIERDGVTFFEGAVELLGDVRRRGLRIAIATSASPDDIEIVERLVGRRLDELTDVVTTKEDAATSKPAPDILQAACDKLGEEPLACLMVGDALHDATAARAAGVAFAGVTSGFADEATFRRAGARFVARDLGHLRASIGEALAAASRARVRLDGPTFEGMMAHALDAARAALGRGEVPIGAALFDRDGRLLATGANRATETGDVTAHAEMEAFRGVAAGGATVDSGTTLVSTLEPCVMCLGAAMEAGVDAVVYGLGAPSNGGASRVDRRCPRVRGGIAADRSRDLFTRWLTEVGAGPHRPFVEQLLGSTA